MEIFRQMGQLFLPNYMAILMHKTLAETHLDLATVFFKLVTRFRRYLVILFAYFEYVTFINSFVGKLVKY